MNPIRATLLSTLPALLVIAAWPAHGAQSAKPATPLTLDEVIKLSSAGFAEDVIVTKIKKNGKAFDLSTEELLELKKLGLSDTVIKFLLDPSLPYAGPVVPPASPTPNHPPPEGSPPSAPVKQYPPDVFAGSIPPELGLYRVADGVSSKIDVKILLGADKGMSKVLKGKIVAYLVGPASKERVKETMPVFYLRLAPGKAIEEIVLIALDRKKDRRELEMGPSEKKQQFKADSMRPFDVLEVGPQLFKITRTKLDPGEYLFFQMGSAELPKGSYGKGFDFGIDGRPGKPPKK